MAFVVWTVGVVLYFVQRSDKYTSVSGNGMVGYVCALYAWVLFAFINPVFLLFVPALHSLQYLLFVWKLQFEKTRTRLKAPKSIVWKAMLPFLGIGMGAGLLLFYILPTQLDAHLPYNPGVFGPQLYMFCFMIFLNVHHYFIDHAIWRHDNPQMKKYLF